MPALTRIPTENECGMALCPAILSRGVILAGLTWAMPLAQIMSLQMINHAIKTDPADPEYIPAKEMLSMYTTTSTLMGIPVGIDTTLHESIIELRLKGEVIWRVECLATPCMFETWRTEQNQN